MYTHTDLQDVPGTDKTIVQTREQCIHTQTHTHIYTDIHICIHSHIFIYIFIYININLRDIPGANEAVIRPREQPPLLVGRPGQSVALLGVAL